MIFPANSLVMKGLQPGGFTLPYTIISYNGRPERWITPFWQPAYPLPSASVARVWRYRNLFITITFIFTLYFVHGK